MKTPCGDGMHRGGGGGNREKIGVCFGGVGVNGKPGVGRGRADAHIQRVRSGSAKGHCV